MSDQPSELLLTWISQRLSGSSKDWFDQQLTKLVSEPSVKSFDIAFAMVPRKLGKQDLAPTATELAAAAAARTGWNPSQWSIDVAARIYLLTRLSEDPSVNFTERFRDLHRTADVGELLALFSGLPLYRRPETLVAVTADGLRTNIKAEFEVIAHRNPFPVEQFSQNPWNNMVLKALFIGVMLEPIQGLDERANPELARILSDYAHERWAAERFVSPELWRCIGPFAEAAYLDDFQRVIDQGSETEIKAVALALKTAPPSTAKENLAAQLTAYDEIISNGQLSWRQIADEMLDNSQAITRKLNFEVELTR